MRRAFWVHHRRTCWWGRLASEGLPAQQDASMPGGASIWGGRLSSALREPQSEGRHGPVVRESQSVARHSPIIRESQSEGRHSSCPSSAPIWVRRQLLVRGILVWWEISFWFGDSVLKPNDFLLGKCVHKLHFSMENVNSFIHYPCIYSLIQPYLSNTCCAFTKALISIVLGGFIWKKKTGSSSLKNTGLI